MQQQSIAASLQQARRAIVRPLQDDEELRQSPLASISLGQWCLPMLLSYQFDRPLITGRFTPQPMRPANLFNESLNNISLPAHFIGRRRELRRRQRAFREGTSALLMLTGAGGMGKTALAGKLLNTLKADGYEIFAFSARPEHNWRDTVLQMELALDEIRVAKYSKIQQAYAESSKRIEMLLKLLLEQFGSQVALFFDNLESLQDATTRALTDPELQHWIDAAVRMKAQGVKGLRVVLTSRWALPEWPEQLYPLGKPVYRDFLAVAQQQKLPKQFLTDFKRLRQAYEVLGGNYRALEFFAAALQKMNTIEEEQIVASLRGATEEIQTNMLLELVYSHRQPAEQQLLRILVAYEVPVAFEGVKALVLDKLEQPEKALEALLSVSLIERTENKAWQAEEFLVSPLVRDWLLQQEGETVSCEQLQRAAGYLQWLLENERGTVEQAIVTYAALIAAGMNEEAYLITLKWIVKPMSMAGMYQTLLLTWLPPACYSAVPKTLAGAMGETGIQYLHLGDYDTALEYLNRSLSISQEIGDKKGRTLLNIAGIYRARGDYDTAQKYLTRSLSIMQEIPDKQGQSATLNNFGEIYRLRGEYDIAEEYLTRSLLIQQEIGDKSGESITLNNISLIFQARGDYDTAQKYLTQSFSISQESGDNTGLCNTLFNMGHIHAQNEDLSNAVSSWVAAYRIASKINIAEGLQNLASLAMQIGLPGGLDGWQQLSQQMGEGE